MSVGADAIAEFASTYTVERAAAPAVVKGRAVPAVPAEVPIRACIQPVPGGRDLLLLPEEMRTRETIAVFSLDPIRTADDAAGTPADVVRFGAEKYQLQTVLDWSALGGFYKGIATKVPR